MAKEDKHKWAFAPRFRARAFGWKSQPAITRVREAGSEIKKMARRDPAVAAEGAVLFLAKVSPALEQVDSSSGAIGTAVNHAIDELVPIIVVAPWSEKQRDTWLERLWDAFQEDDILYIELLGDRWGDLCVTPERASRWVDRLLSTLKMCWSEQFGYFKGTSACLSCLLMAGRHQELLELLETARFKCWHDRKYGVQALAAMGHVDEALAYAEASLGLNDGASGMARLCERILLDAGRRGEAYERYAVTANQASSRLATFRAVAKKYPERDRKQVLAGLIDSTPGEEGKWFATACELDLYDLALALVRESPCDPKTLNRAARDNVRSRPAFALDVALLSLHWLSRGWGWEITSGDVWQACDLALNAARELGREVEVIGRIEALVTNDQSVGMFIQRVLGPHLDSWKARTAASL